MGNVQASGADLSGSEQGAAKIGTQDKGEAG